MHLWSPAAFAVVNEPVDKGLRILRVTFGRRASLKHAQGYKDLTAAIEHVASVTGLRSFARVDHFFDALGKGHIGRSRSDRTVRLRTVLHRAGKRRDRPAKAISG